MTLDPGVLDAVAAVAAIRNGKFSAAQYAEALADRVAEHADLNAIQHFDADQLVLDAAEAFQACPDAALSGLPIVAKDNINTAALPDFRRNRRPTHQHAGKGCRLRHENHRGGRIHRSQVRHARTRIRDHFEQHGSPGRSETRRIPT